MTASDTRTPNVNHKDEDFHPRCVAGTCDCAPHCYVCGKGKCWDVKQWPGHHDWRCGYCHQANFYTAWKPAEVGRPWQRAEPRFSEDEIKRLRALLPSK
jgi:hypothetical protein